MKRFRSLLAIPLYPAVLALGAFFLELPLWPVVLLGLLAATGTVLAVLLLLPRKEGPVPPSWKRDLKTLRKTVEGIGNRDIAAGGSNVLSELKRCRTSLPFLSTSARREITQYYLPTFLKYFEAYATFEACNEGNPAILATMAQMETAIGEISENFRRTCERNEKTASLQLHAETAVLCKKLNTKEGIDHEVHRTAQPE